MTKYQCLICFEECVYPAILDLKCECQYNVHYKCYNKWWKMKRTCIICHELTGHPRSYYRFRDKDNYRFLLDLNNKPNTNRKNQELISNKWFHGSIICTMCVPLYYFSIHISIVLLITFIYFIMVIP